MQKPPPITLDTNEVIGLDVDASYIILIRKGSENQKAIRDFMERVGIKKNNAKEPPPQSKKPPISLQTEDIGIFAIHDTHHIMIVKKGGENETLIREFIMKHGNKIPRPKAQ